jgi:hypothetical protein
VNEARQIKIHTEVKPITIKLACRKCKRDGALLFMTNDLNIIPNSVLWICSICSEQNFDELIFPPEH